MTSLYYYLQDHHPDRLKNLSFSAFLRAEGFLYSGSERPAQSHAAYWNSYVTAWLDQPDLLFVSFENMIMDYAGTLGDVGRVLHLELPDNITNVVRTRKIVPKNKLLRGMLTRFVSLYRRLLSTVGAQE